MPEPAVDLEVVAGSDVAPPVVGLDAVDEQLIAQLAGRARAGGLALTGQGWDPGAADQAADRGRPGR